jgi:C_GCAxxG_C_C family probable redox protein
MSNENQTAINRRDLLKLSLAAGATLAVAGITGVAEAGIKEKSPADRPEAAKAHFLKSMNCSQAILETYSPAFGLKPEHAKKLATGFAGGMGMGHDCGAVTAAYMVLGLAHGPKEGKVFPKLEAFNKEFKARHRELGCSQLLGVDMGTKEGVKEAEKKGLFTSRCPGYVKTAAEVLERILA